MKIEEDADLKQHSLHSLAIILRRSSGGFERLSPPQPAFHFPASITSITFLSQTILSSNSVLNLSYHKGFSWVVYWRDYTSDLSTPIKRSPLSVSRLRVGYKALSLIILHFLLLL